MVDMGPPVLNGPEVPTTLPTNSNGLVLEQPIQVIDEKRGVFPVVADVLCRFSSVAVSSMEIGDPAVSLQQSRVEAERFLES